MDIPVRKLTILGKKCQNYRKVQFKWLIDVEEIIRIELYWLLSKNEIGTSWGQRYYTSIWNKIIGEKLLFASNVVDSKSVHVT